MTLENGFQVWLSLVDSGIEEVRQNYLPGYDAELVAVLKQRLYPLATNSLERELRDAPPSTESFLEAFFGALKPFSQMLRDVLRMFEAAGARRSDENLRIAFNFDDASEALALTLKEFRETEKFFRHVARSVVVRQWNSNTLSLLRADVQSVMDSLNVARTMPVEKGVRDAHVRRWVADNGRPTWLPFPGLPSSGDRELDEALAMAENLISQMMSEVGKLGSTYREFERSLRDLPSEDYGEDEAGREMGEAGDERPSRSFVRGAHDFWPNFFAAEVCLAVESINAHRDEHKRERAGRLAEAIRAGFDRPPRSARTRFSLEQDFRDLVNLPIWKKRHELYAVWVASCIAEALGDLSWQWHPDGNTLRFPFSGVELATLRGADCATHIFWTEKRTKLKGGGLFGRRHIQPDYRIMTVPTHSDDATSLVVECKQYRNWSRKNFGSALDDYAKGCPNALVILVNYGRTDPNIIELVDSSRRSRTFLVGDFKPGGDGSLNRFRGLVQSAYPAHFTSGSVAAEIELSWGPEFRDLDLHVFIRRPKIWPLQHVGFGSELGSLTESPWAKWSGDARQSPPGNEKVTISRWLDAEYDVFVHDYSGTPGFPNGDVNVRVRLLPNQDEYGFVSAGGSGRWWFVCRIDGTSRRIEKVNRVDAEIPHPPP